MRRNRHPVQQQNFEKSRTSASLPPNLPVHAGPLRMSRPQRSAAAKGVAARIDGGNDDDDDDDDVMHVPSPIDKDDDGDASVGGSEDDDDDEDDDEEDEASADEAAGSDDDDAFASKPPPKKTASAKARKAPSAEAPPAKKAKVAGKGKEAPQPKKASVLKTVPLNDPACAPKASLASSSASSLAPPPAAKPAAAKKAAKAAPSTAAADEDDGGDFDAPAPKKAPAKPTAAAEALEPDEAAGEAPAAKLAAPAAKPTAPAAKPAASGKAPASGPSKAPAASAPAPSATGDPVLDFLRQACAPMTAQAIADHFHGGLSKGEAERRCAELAAAGQADTRESAKIKLYWATQKGAAVLSEKEAADLEREIADAKAQYLRRKLAASAEEIRAVRLQKASDLRAGGREPSHRGPRPPSRPAAPHRCPPRS